MLRAPAAAAPPAAAPPAPPTAKTQESAPKQQPPPPPVEKAVWKDNPLEDALSALSVADRAAQEATSRPQPAAAPQAAPKPKPAPVPASGSGSGAPRPGGFVAFSFNPSGEGGSSSGAAKGESPYPKTVRQRECHERRPPIPFTIPALPRLTPATARMQCEGLREAVKSRDDDAVFALLAAGLDAKYKDSQGMSLLHVAAMFNATAIALALIDAGALPDVRNAQGETVYGELLPQVSILPDYLPMAPD